jgi:hypothetical protein
MHFIYRIYCLVACIHPAISLLILSIGYAPHTRALALVLTEDSVCFTANTTHQVQEAHPFETDISSAYFLACLASSGYAMLFLAAMDNDSGDESDDQVRLADLLFWCFLLLVSFLSLGCLSQHIASNEQLPLRTALHFGGLYLICSPRREKHNLSIYIAVLVVLASAVMAASAAACSQPALVLCYLHRFLDLLLIVGHRWDQGEGPVPMETVFNTRMAYIALGGVLLHADAIVGSHPPS